MIEVRRGGVLDTVEFLQAASRSPLPARVYGSLLAQTALSETYAVYLKDGDQPVAIAGIAPLGEMAGEIWFGVQPSGLGALLLPVVRETRRVLRERKDAYPGGLMCLVKDGYEPGERLASLIGCVKNSLIFQGLREWIWTDGISRGSTKASVWTNGVSDAACPTA
jgi:hypothetical protein